MYTQIFIPYVDKSITKDNIIDVIQFEYGIGKIKSINVTNIPNDDKNINVYINIQLNSKSTISQHLMNGDTYSIPVIKYSNYEDRTCKILQLNKI